MNHGVLGFNSERQDPVSGVTHLGNGYRAFHPVLMRFTCPDGWSPFGMGGINAYAYCAGDPVNRADPSGHIGWQGVMGIVTGAIGIALVPFTLGQSLTVTVAIIAGLETLSGATSIASGILETVNPQASSALGWVSFAMGIASVGTGIAAMGMRALKKIGTGLSTSMDSRNGIQLERYVSAQYTLPGMTITDLPNEILTKNIIPHLDNSGLAHFSQLSYRMNSLAKPHLLARLERELITFVDKFRGQPKYTEQFAFLYKWYTVNNKTDDMLNVFEHFFNQHVKNPAYGPLVENFNDISSRYSYIFSRKHGLIAFDKHFKIHFTADRETVMDIISSLDQMVSNHPGPEYHLSWVADSAFPHRVRRI